MSIIGYIFLERVGRRRTALRLPVLFDVVERRDDVSYSLMNCIMVTSKWCDEATPAVDSCKTKRFVAVANQLLYSAVRSGTVAVCSECPAMWILRSLAV